MAGASLTPSAARPQHYGPYRSWTGSLDAAKSEWRVVVWRQPGWTRVCSLVPETSSSPAVPSDLYVINLLVTTSFYLDEEGAEIPKWSRAHVAQRVEQSPATLVEDGFGWPGLSMRARFQADASSSIVRGAVLEGLPFREGRRMSGTITDFAWPRALPLRPIWPAFLANTILDSAALWLLFAASGIVRRRIRAHRGRCSACGYDLRGSGGRGTDRKVCPECGASARKPV